MRGVSSLSSVATGRSIHFISLDAALISRFSSPRMHTQTEERDMVNNDRENHPAFGSEFLELSTNGRRPSGFEKAEGMQISITLHPQDLETYTLRGSKEERLRNAYLPDVERDLCAPMCSDRDATATTNAEQRVTAML